MEPSRYLLVPKRDLSKLAKAFDPSRIIADAKFVVVISDDLKKVSKLAAVLDWRMDDWTDWGFDLYGRGKLVAEGRFRDGDEKVLVGLVELAELLDVDAAALQNVLGVEEPDVFEFMNVMGIPEYAITPEEMDRAIETRGTKRSSKAEQYDPWPRKESKPRKPRTTKPTKKAAKRRVKKK